MADLILKKDTRHDLAAPIGRALVQPSTPTPLALPAPARPRRDPPGGPRAPISLPLCVTPFSHSGLTGRFGARTWTGANGVGGAGFPGPGQRGRADLTTGVRT